MSVHALLAAVESGGFGFRLWKATTAGPPDAVVDAPGVCAGTQRADRDSLALLGAGAGATGWGRGWDWGTRSRMVWWCSRIAWVMGGRW